MTDYKDEDKMDTISVYSFTKGHKKSFDNISERSSTF